MEMQRIADSIRVADSLAMVLDYRQKVADSISRIPKKSGNWILKNYVDEFGK